MTEDWQDERRKILERAEDLTWPPKDPQPRDIEAARRKMKGQEEPEKTEQVPAQETAPPQAESESAARPRVRRPMRDGEIRTKAIGAVKEEAKKKEDRLSIERGKRIQRMRSRDPRRGEKAETGVSHEERVRRINFLLRAGLYDRKHAEDIPEKVTAKMLRRASDGTLEKYDVEESKEDVKAWLFGENGLTEYERQRLYVIGRKKMDFRMTKEKYPELTDEEFEEEKIFQKDQKELADALEIVAVPMLQAIFKKIGKNVDVYLTAANDDIAGGLDIAVDLKKLNGEPHRFPEGSPMRFVIDMTYARMREKIDNDLKRGRISRKAYDILKGKGYRGKPDEVDPALSNARAMKLFRTVVETLGGEMSTLTFDKKGPLVTPQKHVPRLIIGLDWSSAFSSIADWVEQGDAFEEEFKKTGLSERIAQSIENQLRGLHALTLQDPTQKNPNTEYLAHLLRTMDFRVDERRLTQDKSLENIDRLLTLDTEPLKSWQRNRLYDAALAQIKHDRERGGGHVRGDMTKEPAKEKPPIFSKFERNVRDREPGRKLPPTPPPIRTEPELEPEPAPLPSVQLSDEERRERIRKRIIQLEFEELKKKIRAALDAQR